MENDEFQNLVDTIIVQKALLDEMKKNYEDMVNEYRRLRLETSKMPKGDTSDYGDVTFVYNRATEDEVVSEFIVTDDYALRNDKSEDFKAYLEGTWLPDNLARAAEDYFHEVGECLDGCAVVQTVIPGKRKSIKYVKVTPDKEVRLGVGDWLRTNIRGLIEV